MATFSETFNFVYSVHVEHGQLVIEKAKPVAKGVTVTDDDDELTHHDRFKIDTRLPGDDHHEHGHSGHEHLTFVSLAHDAGGDQGFIAKDGDGHLFFFTQDAISGKHDDHLFKDPGSEHICFMAGTRVSTPSGAALVEELAVGDLVLTVEGTPAAIRWVGRQTVSRRFLDELRLPVRVKAGAIDVNVPSRDLCLSPDHAVLVEGVLIQAGALVNGTSITRLREAPPTFVYYHIETEHHRLILAENTPVETFIDNVGRMNFDNWREYQELYPEDRAMSELPLARAKSWRQVPLAARRKLAGRAVSVGEMLDAA